MRVRVGFTAVQLTVMVIFRSTFEASVRCQALPMRLSRLSHPYRTAASKVAQDEFNIAEAGLDSFESRTTAGRGEFLKGKAKQIYSGPERIRATTS